MSALYRTTVLIRKSLYQIHFTFHLDTIPRPMSHSEESRNIKTVYVII